MNTQYDGNSIMQTIFITLVVFFKIESYVEQDSYLWSFCNVVFHSAGY